MNVQVRLPGTEHWTHKGDVKLFLWNKGADDPAKTRGTILFVHGSSMASQPTFDLAGAGAAGFLRDGILRARRATTAGASTWRATAAPTRTATTTRRSRSARTTATRPRPTSRSCAAPRPLLVYGISSGALRAALFAERHPELVARLALDAMVWTGEGSPTLAERRKKLPEFSAEEPPPDRPRLRALDLQPRPSRHRRGRA